MKISIDTNTNTVKVGSKVFGNDMPKATQDQVETYLRHFLVKNTKMTDYEEDGMWMSYRYCIGRKTIAAHSRAIDIWKNCKGRMSNDRQLFTAYDINREIEQHLAYGYPSFYFPITSLNRIYSTAVDIVCDFIEEYHITSKEEFLKYKDVHIIFSDNERGYKFETVTWDEYVEAEASKIFQLYYGDYTLPSHIWKKRFDEWVKDRDLFPEISDSLEKLYKQIPNPEYFYMTDFEDLFIWNDLVHLFDTEHYHKSVLKDGTECEWFWSWVEKTEQREDGYHYKTFGYEKVRIPVDKWNGHSIVWIPDDAIKENLY